MSDPLHIGILAHSAEGATLSYRTVWHEGVRKMGAHDHPRITMSGGAMAPTLELWERDDLAALRQIFREDAERLAAAGADFFILPDNTAHIALEQPGPDFPIPCLHIAEVVAAQAEADGRRHIAVLGTNWTMEGPVYKDALARRSLERSIPAADDREIIHTAIFDELCLGDFRDETRAEFIRIIGNLQSKGCDAVALVCTEIPLLITDETSPLPILDSTRLQAKAAVAVALGERVMPIWSGGVV
ncbi:aspartate/glutamate racemase family protein [Parasphingorhabdus cellanae]|uniref:Amino acid racemase n=1 Tax=Parasphingorhabdus cellanae TaxID=2806553 RepID=A0ABX7T7G6_9SPHN|nr:amino acid racemase [Parasphingorhabdus cellanae]QTD56737.1 amino acid racemase [Parasphingorhabdus cellanae]